MLKFIRDVIIGANKQKEIRFVDSILVTKPLFNTIDNKTHWGKDIRDLCIRLVLIELPTEMLPVLY